MRHSDAQSPEGIARWANLPLDVRISDQIADIMIALECIRDMLSTELHGSVDIEPTLDRMYADASSLMVRLPDPPRDTARDLEFQQVLDRIGTAIRAMDAEQGPQRDEALCAAEQIAAPYALSLYYEVGRLDAMIGHRFRLAASCRSGHRNKEM